MNTMQGWKRTAGHPATRRPYKKRENAEVALKRFRTYEFVKNARIIEVPLGFRES